METNVPEIPGVAKLNDFVENRLRNRESKMATMMSPVIAGYAFDRAADLTDPATREQLSPTAVKAFARIVDKWKLTENQARGLLGGIASSTYHAWRNEPRKQKLSQDVLVRISLVIGIYKALNIYFGKPWADQWITLGNRGTMFGGTAPIDYMIRQGQPGMSQVRRLLDSWRGGK